MKVVIDTNVLISAFITPRGVPGQIVRSVARFHFITSEEILDELGKVLRYPHILASYDKTEKQVAGYMRKIRKASRVIRVTVNAKGATRDPKDDKFVACALSANADYIVSGDRHLLEKGLFEDTEVILPTDFLALLHSITNRRK